MSHCHLIRHATNHVWWRPNAEGYTTQILEAGLYGPRGEYGSGDRAAIRPGEDEIIALPDALRMFVPRVDPWVARLILRSIQLPSNDRDRSRREHLRLESLAHYDAARDASRLLAWEIVEGQTRAALEKAIQAAELAPLGLEPTRSVLYRSAATLAVQAHEHQRAFRLACEGLRGDPPQPLRDELLEVLEVIDKEMQDRPRHRYHFTERCGYCEAADGYRVERGFRRCNKCGEPGQ